MQTVRQDEDSLSAREPEPRHVALYIPELTGGGVQKRMLTLATAFAERGHKVDLLLCATEGRLSGQVSSDIRIIGLEPATLWRARIAALASDPLGLGVLLRPVILARKPSRSLAYLPDLARYLGNERPAALLAAKPDPNLEAVWARRLARVATRVVVSERIAPSGKVKASRMWRRRYAPPLTRRTYLQAEGIIAVSDGVAEDLVALTGIPRPRVTTIYNPMVDQALLDKAAAPLDHPWFAAGAPPVILGAGRLHPDKDFATLLRAFARVRERRPVRLVIMGEARRGERLDALLALADDLGVAEDLELPGYVDNPCAYMARAGAFVLSSLSEGLPGVLIEALACGCPVVSTDCPSGPREVLAGGRYGPLVAMGDHEAMAAAILTVLDDPPDHERLSARGAEFSVDLAADHYLELLLGPP